MAYSTVQSVVTVRSPAARPGFTRSFPNPQCCIPVDPWPERSVEARVAGGEAGVPDAASTGRRVLVVDDHRDTADTLADLLELWGHSVRVAYSGTRALECARQFCPTAVLCNLGMPGMDGCELARRLLREPACSGALLIAITGYCREEDRDRTREAGFHFHLAKPIDPEELLEALRVPGAL